MDTVCCQPLLREAKPRYRFYTSAFMAPETARCWLGVDRHGASNFRSMFHFISQMFLAENSPRDRSIMEESFNFFPCESWPQDSAWTLITSHIERGHDSQLASWKVWLSTARHVGMNDNCKRGRPSPGGQGTDQRGSWTRWSTSAFLFD